MNSYDYDTLDLGRCILNHGEWVYNDRTNTKCLTYPSFKIYYDPKSIPLSTLKQSYPVSAFAEILGYLRRYEWADQFDRIGTKTWYGNANETEAWLNNPNRLGENHMGKVYGAALEDWELPQLFDKLMKHEDDRGLKINFWRPEKFDKGCLRPCLYDHSFTLINGKLYLKSLQRSCDFALGFNFNSLQIWLLFKFVCHITGLKEGGIEHNLTNIHIYENHIDGVKEMLSRKPICNTSEFKINDWVRSFDDLVGNDKHAREYFKITGYEHHDPIKFEMVV